MTLGQALQQATSVFKLNDIEDAHLEARVLLSYMLNLSAAELYTKTEQNLSKEQEKSFSQLIQRRLNREPTAYIINRKEFYGLDFFVDQRVLIPRPETELIVEEALEFAKRQSNKLDSEEKPLIVADIGTGCGNIAICLALNIVNIKIFAVDISLSALEVARLNCEYYKVTEKIILLQGNLLEPITNPVDLIVANLPYIKNTELNTVSPESTFFEPKSALDGGKEGLKQIRQLLKQAKGKIQQHCCLMIEIGKGQENIVTKFIKQYLPNATIDTALDLNNINRVVKISI